MSRYLPPLALGAVLLAACGTPKLDNSQRAKIVGDWVNPESGARLSIYPDGDFQFDAGGQQVIGTLQRGGDQISVTYSIPATLCQGSSGLYHFERNGNVLNFDLVRDNCPERVAQILQYWTSASEPETPGPSATSDGSATRPTLRGTNEARPPRRMRPGQ